MSIPGIAYSFRERREWLRVDRPIASTLKPFLIKMKGRTQAAGKTVEGRGMKNHEAKPRIVQRSPWTHSTAVTDREQPLSQLDISCLHVETQRTAEKGDLFYLVDVGQAKEGVKSMRVITTSILGFHMMCTISF
jgi:hypothetical protein